MTFPPVLEAPIMTTSESTTSMSTDTMEEVQSTAETRDEIPPPTYAPCQPQILVVPLPDSISFFKGRTVQGEIFVKGLGGQSSSSAVRSLTAKLDLSDRLPGQEVITLLDLPEQTLYHGQHDSITSSEAGPSTPFPSSHKFSIPLPPSSTSSQSYSSSSVDSLSETDPHWSDVRPLPGTLDLSSTEKGEIRWQLTIRLILSSGEDIKQTIKIEGTPPDIPLDEGEVAAQVDQGEETSTRPSLEAEEIMIKPGVKVRLLVDNPRPRLGDLLRLGVEIQPVFSEKSNLPGPSTSAPDPRDVLRPLRRVRVELFRKVDINGQSSSSAHMGTAAVHHEPEGEASSSTSTSLVNHQTPSRTHLNLLHASGKSLRYPGPNPAYPPLRLLFTLPSPSLGTGSDPTWGEISMRTPYHNVTFFLRVTIGFGSALLDGGNSMYSNGGGGEGSSKDWIMEKEITYRPMLWRDDLRDDGQAEIPTSETEDITFPEADVEGLSEETTRAAYRLKGRDVVGSSGTTRPDASNWQTNESDLPPPFDSQAGPSNHLPLASASVPDHVNGQSELPTFLESEEQMKTGDIPLVRQHVPEPEPIWSSPDPRSEVGRRSSLPGELGTWVEYDGYETFSMQPPSMADSFGVGGSMDPPKDGDEDDAGAVVGGMVARLGLRSGSVSRAGGLELMEELGLGEGTRVVDLQDDLPPGIDEPSLPALPDFRPVHSRTFRPVQPQTQGEPNLITPEPEAENLPPPSFDASEAAEAVGGTARAGEMGITMSRQASMSVGAAGIRMPRTEVQQTRAEGEAPPGYFGQNGGGIGAVSGSPGHGGLPPYS